MSQEHAFTIPWSIRDEQWDNARVAMAEHRRGSSYDSRGLGRCYLLEGDVDFVFDNSRFTAPPTERRASTSRSSTLRSRSPTLTLGKQFAPGAKAKYDQLDDDLQIEFAGEGECVRVSASDRPSVPVVPRSAFERGVRHFLCGLAGAIEAELEGALEWESMAPLKKVAARFRANR